MKKLIFLLVLVLVVTLTACTPEPVEELDYSSFEEHLISSYDEATYQNQNKYIVYYYSQNCGHCVEVKEDILEFFDNYDALPFYIFNISDADDVSDLDEFVGTPTVFVMSDNKVSESYIGSTNIYSFIAEYEIVGLDYISFNDLHLITYQEILDIEQDTYIIYYYLDNCQDCMLIKDSLLTWTYTKSVGDIYFMNGDSVVAPTVIPSELIILNSGSPIIIIMSNGEFTDEYYLGSEEILEYIQAIGEGKIRNLE